jgi:hypothetical protein
MANTWGRASARATTVGTSDTTAFTVTAGKIWVIQQFAYRIVTAGGAGFLRIRAKKSDGSELAVLLDQTNGAQNALAVTDNARGLILEDGDILAFFVDASTLDEVEAVLSYHEVDP